MSTQLRLIEPVTPAWRLDDDTKRVGRAGLEAARAALRNSRPRYPAPDTKAA